MDTPFLNWFSLNHSLNKVSMGESSNTIEIHYKMDESQSKEN